MTTQKVKESCEWRKLSWFSSDFFHGLRFRLLSTRTRQAHAVWADESAAEDEFGFSSDHCGSQESGRLAVPKQVDIRQVMSASVGMFNIPTWFKLKIVPFVCFLLYYVVCMRYEDVLPSVFIQNQEKRSVSHGPLGTAMKRAAVAE